MNNLWTLKKQLQMKYCPQKPIQQRSLKTFIQMIYLHQKVFLKFRIFWIQDTIWNQASHIIILQNLSISTVLQNSRLIHRQYSREKGQDLFQIQTMMVVLRRIWYGWTNMIWRPNLLRKLLFQKIFWPHWIENFLEIILLSWQIWTAAIEYLLQTILIVILILILLLLANRASMTVNMGDRTGRTSRNLRPRQHMDKLSKEYIFMEIEVEINGCNINCRNLFLSGFWNIPVYCTIYICFAFFFVNVLLL